MCHALSSTIHSDRITDLIKYKNDFKVVLTTRGVEVPLRRFEGTTTELMPMSLHGSPEALYINCNWKTHYPGTIYIHDSTRGADFI